MATKKERIIQEIARAVGAGREVSLETVDFANPARAKTCLEVDFPILPINGIAKMEAHAGVTTKPVYQMSKWWARRPSSVFRSLLIAAATKAPDDPSHAAKLVWDNYYANHQKKGAFNNIKVADIFMGGGTTLVEGSRLGMQMSGNDLNPVAWFVVKQELADVELDKVERLLADIEAEDHAVLLLRRPEWRRRHVDAQANWRSHGLGFRSAGAEVGGAERLQLRRPRDNLHLLGKAWPLSGNRLRPSHTDYDRSSDGY